VKKSWIIGLMIGSMVVSSAGTYTGLKWMEATEQQKEEIPFSLEDKGSFDVEKIKKVYEVILNGYVEEVNENELIEGAIEGMVSTLNDPYSVYMDEQKAAQFNQTLDSSFEGIGAEISVVDGKKVIVAPFKNSPAEKAGIKPNDEILKVDGESVESLDLYETTLKIRGKKGTTVQLEIKREGLSKPITLEVKRDKIPIETVFSKVIEKEQQKIGYIEITSFSKETGKDFKSSLKELEQEGIQSLIIDVRGNPGGLLSSVEEILSTLVSNKKPYVQIEQRDGNRQATYSNQKEGKEYPIVVLTDEGSASASEILVGALKEIENSTIIGEKTFGKGTVQQAIPLGDGSNLKITLYKWLTPDGNWIHRKGIEPDIFIEKGDLYETHPIQVEEPLKQDMNNEQVKNAQVILKSIGYEPGRQDGYFSKTTETAVKAFQLENGLKATGVIDGKTASLLEGKVIEAMKKEHNDRQLQAAIHYLSYQLYRQ